MFNYYELESSNIVLFAVDVGHSPPALLRISCVPPMLIFSEMETSKHYYPVKLSLVL